MGSKMPVFNQLVIGRHSMQSITRFLIGVTLVLCQVAHGSDAGQLYAVQTESSYLHVYTGKAGLLKKLGHNHIISAKPESGQIKLGSGDDRLNSTASLVFRVTDFVVDDSTLRKAAGEGFESQPGARDIEGTRKNMLGSKLLNSDPHPEVNVSISLRELNGESANFDVQVQVAGFTAELQLAGTLSQQGNQLIADAEFTLDHADLGLKPFKAAAGAIKVAKQLRFLLHVEAKK